ncbi:MAG: hypothetical protein Q8N53_14735 [Longimicrobiales bacterium]|nr:hypothetical protein [Longimicrobiales bacterium]
MSPAFRWSIAVAAALAFAAPVSAQQRVSGDVGVAPLTSSMRATAPAISLAPTMATMVPLPPQARQSQSVAMMIVGGAGLIVGSLIGGDTGTIVMVGSGVIGLVGLFRYLR